MKKINYINVKKHDAKRLMEMLKELDSQTEYMMYEYDERLSDENAINKLIEGIESDNRINNFLVVAECDGKFVGFISAKKGFARKIKHSAYIVVGVLKDFRSMGIGYNFFKLLDDWAIKNSIVRLELTVICENEIAKRLYEKCGFNVEGIKKKSIFMKNKFYDEFYMAKIN
ncbi:MAG: GNAT family N-acetyltransferase [Peptoniphilaceae bacterium]|uniref:GNAT family N-acetyltransferase n=1 Tax=Parvimonas sp. TaxID=1944660 RepID=UPI0025D77D4F|nr:GNAT family N-acetyltransferase [Parvimonas sp.]MCI5996817.1 GNAT family N-acetyltransferase [Parvimonas sp.]MDD7764798.1 GNAT family N-acetyltransferase [Peptoniphilaceae bacterium]MDY3050870.1 GNAT family N-acetyltransferase [Parvimonas sp.]